MSYYTIFVIIQQSNFQLFQAVCVIVAFLSWLLMRYTGMNVQVAVEASTTSSTQNEGDWNLQKAFYYVQLTDNWKLTHWCVWYNLFHITCTEGLTSMREV